MTAAQLVLATLAAAGAAYLVRRDPRYRALAWYLALAVACSLVRTGLGQLLPPGPAERVGWDAWLRAADQGAYLVQLWALPGLLGVEILRR